MKTIFDDTLLTEIQKRIEATTRGLEEIAVQIERLNVTPTKETVWNFYNDSDYIRTQRAKAITAETEQMKKSLGLSVLAGAVSQMAAEQAAKDDTFFITELYQSAVRQMSWARIDIQKDGIATFAPDNLKVEKIVGTESFQRQITDEEFYKGIDDDPKLTPQTLVDDTREIHRYQITFTKEFVKGLMERAKRSLSDEELAECDRLKNFFDLYCHFCRTDDYFQVNDALRFWSRDDFRTKTEADIFQFYLRHKTGGRSLETK